MADDGNSGIPELNGDGVLPPGLYPCTLAEVRERFGSFQGTDRRVYLHAKLESYARAAFASGCVTEIVVDGSFVTAKPDPGDVDLVVVLAPGFLPGGGDFAPREYDAVSPRRISKLYGFDALVVPHGGAARDGAIAFFCQVKGRPELTKGLLVIRP